MTILLLGLTLFRTFSILSRSGSDTVMRRIQSKTQMAHLCHSKLILEQGKLYCCDRVLSPLDMRMGPFSAPSPLLWLSGALNFP